MKILALFFVYWNVLNTSMSWFLWHEIKIQHCNWNLCTKINITCKFTMNNILTYFKIRNKIKFPALYQTNINTCFPTNTELYNRCIFSSTKNTVFKIRSKKLLKKFPTNEFFQNFWGFVFTWCFHPKYYIYFFEI